MLYAGPLDGLVIDASKTTARSFILPVKEQPDTLYHESKEWSDHFKRRVATHENFPGLPPKRELQEA
ncbi:hypothetical protein [Prosthecobacter sp.]|uniref:hypothetical protein n=1 Tax=Prosthecobacter sp. TaxID=1965333 RepID=UPI0026176423|nr:hypothetical protein [Prosthecobacter sp.]